MKRKKRDQIHRQLHGAEEAPNTLIIIQEEQEDLISLKTMQSKYWDYKDLTRLNSSSKKMERLGNVDRNLIA